MFYISSILSNLKTIKEIKYVISKDFHFVANLIFCWRKEKRWMAIIHPGQVRKLSLSFHKSLENSGFKLLYIFSCTLS